MFRETDKMQLHRIFRFFAHLVARLVVVWRRGNSLVYRVFFVLVRNR